MGVTEGFCSQNSLQFLPVYDGNFFPKSISIMRKEEVVNNVPYIVGCNTTEGHGIMNMGFVKCNSEISKKDYENEFKDFCSEKYWVSIIVHSFEDLLSNVLAVFLVLSLSSLMNLSAIGE